MKRVHMLEFEDLNWFPSWLRTCMTNVIVVLARFIGVPAVLSHQVREALEQAGTKQIVDLGSGGGGSMPEVLDRLLAEDQTAEVNLLLTDLYPNLDAVQTFNNERTPHIRYSRAPVDATSLATAPEGLKTMVNCFHHMTPDMARKILSGAEANRQPLLVYEMGENVVPFGVWLLMLPLSLTLTGVMVFFLTPFVRPLTLRQVFFTYCVPLIPIFYAWDGQASMPRIYPPEDLDVLLEGLGSENYRWTHGKAHSAAGKSLGTFLLGLPLNTSAATLPASQAPDQASQ